VGRGAADQAIIHDAKTLSTLKLLFVDEAAVHSITEESRTEITSRSEGYTLLVPGDASPAVLTSNSTLGLFRGLTTFGQLWYYFRGDIYTLEAPVQITDAPAFVGAIPSFDV
jgi:hexosaminidase